MPLVTATRAKQGPNLLSLSRIRYLGACPYGVASRSCCATQASVGDLVTPTWITRRVLSEGVEEGKEWPKEEISDRKARHRPRCSLRDYAETCSTFVLVEALCELLACTSGWFSYRHAGPVSAVPHESFQLPKADCLSPSLSSRQSFLQRPWAGEYAPLTCASSTGGRAPDATSAGYLVAQ